jgi:chromosome segregation ATPase
MEKARERLEKMQGRVNKLLNKKGAGRGKMKGIDNMFNGVKAKLGHLIGKGVGLGYGDLVDELDDLDDELDDIFEDEPGLGKKTQIQLNQMERHRLHIERYMSKIQELEEEGYDVSDLEEMLEEAESLLDAAIAELESGDQEAAEEILDEVNEILDELDDMIDKAE